MFLKLQITSKLPSLEQCFIRYLNYLRKQSKLTEKLWSCWKWEEKFKPAPLVHQIGRICVMSQTIDGSFVLLFMLLCLTSAIFSWSYYRKTSTLRNTSTLAIQEIKTCWQILYTPKKCDLFHLFLFFCLAMLNLSGDTVTLYYALENNSILNMSRMMNWSRFVMCACLSFLKMNSLSLLITGRNLSLISSIQHIPSFLFKVKKCSLVNLLLLLVSAITVSELQSGVVIICVGSMGKCTLLLEEIQLFVKVPLLKCLSAFAVTFKVFLHCWTTIILSLNSYSSCNDYPFNLIQRIVIWIYSLPRVHWAR